EARSIRLARFFQGAAERAIDVMRGPRLARAGTVRVGRNDPRADRLEEIRFVGGEILDRLAPKNRFLGSRVPKFHGLVRRCDWHRDRRARETGALEKIASGNSHAVELNAAETQRRRENSHHERTAWRNTA